MALNVTFAIENLLSYLVKRSMTLLIYSVARSHCDSWAFCYYVTYILIVM